MESEFQDLENTLKSMRPAALEADCMERLLGAVQSRLPEADPHLERRLASLRPAALSGATLDRFAAVVSRVPFPAGENVVLFPGNPKPAERIQPQRRVSWLASAAAVAVLGGFTAFMMDQPDGSGGRSQGVVRRVEASVVPRMAQGNLQPAVNSTVSDTRDEGVFWTRDGKPMRRVRVVYMDVLRHRTPEGRIIEVEKPRVETLLVPETID